MKIVSFALLVVFAGWFSSACTSQVATTATHIAPKVVHRVEVSLPDDLKRQGLRGSVIVSGTVPKEGGVLRNIKVVSSDDSRLDQLVLDAVSQWVWQAGKQNGEAVDVEFTTTVTLR